MTEQVLTDDEKNALLDGVSSGAVPVQGNGGEHYASVLPFEVGPRARIVTNSYPRLQAVHQQFATRLQKRAEGLLQCSVEVSPTGIDVLPWSTWCGQLSGPSVAAAFAAAPLGGNALLVLRAELVGHLVEAFFGGETGVRASTGGASFTPGEMSISNLFCNLVLETMSDAWQPLMAIRPERTVTEVDIDLVDLAGDSDAVIGSAFELSVANQRGSFHVLWPRETVAPVLAALSGGKRERDGAGDARWAKAIRACLADAPVCVTTRVGGVRSALGKLTRVAPGDIIPIDSPRCATILANETPLLKGRFGLCEGRNAVEAVTWLSMEGRNSPISKED